MYFGTDPNVLNVNKLCTSRVVFTYAYYLFHMTFVPFAGYLSVAIYICVYVSYRRAVSHNAGASNNAITDQQRRLTITLGIITVSTLFLFSIPLSVFTLCALMGIASSPIPRYTYGCRSFGLLFSLYCVCNMNLRCRSP
jgi:hypothetical protein